MTKQRKNANEIVTKFLKDKGIIPAVRNQEISRTNKNELIIRPPEIVYIYEQDLKGNDGK